MNYLVFLDAQAGEIERILSGVKTMVIDDFNPGQTLGYHIQPGDSLYFLRDRKECVIRVKAIVTRVLVLYKPAEEDLSRSLKALQPRLQLTEDQYTYWSAKQQFVLVEFESAHKIVAIQIAPEKLENHSNWFAFESFNQLGEEHIGRKFNSGSESH